MSAYELAQSPDSAFDVAKWKPELAKGGHWQWWWVDDEGFHQSSQ